MEKSERYIRIVNTVEYDSVYVHDMFEKYGICPWGGEFGHPVQPDAILAIGGDSAVLKASKFNLPIMAWNQGHLGFLTTGQDLEKILDVYANDELRIDSRRRLSVRVDGRNYLALNEIAVVGKETGRLVETELYIDDKMITTYKGDGLIVSTPTGSTAWNLSAGGSLVEKGVSCILLTPMNPFTMNVRPLIISSQHKLVLGNVEKMVLDGHDIVKPESKTVSIQYDSYPVVLFRLQEENFFEAIIQKLGWNNNIKH